MSSVTPQVMSSDECCAYALSVESADDSDMVTLRCAVHGVQAQVALAEEHYAARIDDWFGRHASCTRTRPHAA